MSDSLAERLRRSVERDATILRRLATEQCTCGTVGMPPPRCPIHKEVDEIR